MKRFRLTGKIILLTVLTLLMQLPLLSIRSLINERTSYRQSVINQIADSTSGPQTLIGPIIVVPYEKTTLSEADEKGKRRYVTRREAFYILPETLSVAATAKVEARKLGIYKAQVYDSNATVQGRFNVARPSELNADNIKLGQPYLSVSVSDMRGIRKVSPISLNGKEFSFRPGAKIRMLEQGLNIDIDSPLKSASLAFSFELGLQGTNRLTVVPVGETTDFSLEGDWPHPNFVASILPAKRSVTDQGFTAQWGSTWFANNMNRRFVRALDDDSEYSIRELPAFSVTLVETVDLYQLSERSVKYGFLFIGLTFIAFFLFEMLKALRIHPVQYLMVSAALVIFYLLLLAMAEHVGFNFAYLCAAIACTGLITYYVIHVLGGVRQGVGFGVLLAMVYAALWGILQSEDNALLLGSLLLLAVLAAVMVLTRRLNWYNLSAPADTPEKT